ncbi:TadE/TadG family type IV pilus assembly protein [Bacillus sp. T3]|uniref:TadE/TadG family type IV pilus assembly protein n=1 Tax=Bacillus sp. T3 TaxID=467262 RepID=UPI0029827E0B|nr:TadE/TadG family type IV pilus assembly protein [Bacillus sp. T3]
MKRLKKFLVNERGQSLVFAAIISIALFGLVALAVDVGNLYLEKAKLQKALDAAVLARVQSLEDLSEEDAEGVAAKISEQNGYLLKKENDEVDATVKRKEVDASVTGLEIWAEKTVTVDMMFAKFVNIDTVDVTAYAKAILSPINSMKGLVPIGIPLVDFKEGQIVNLTFPEKQHSEEEPHPEAGNVGWIDFDGPEGGTDETRDRIDDGYNGTVETGPPNGDPDVYSQPGNPNPLYKQLEQRIKDDENKTYCDDPETADSTCSRLIYVPIIQESTGSGTSPLTIVGFAKFLLSDEGMDTNEFKGQFINFVTPG